MKPAGLPVFPPHDTPGGDCVLARLLAEEPARAGLAWPTGFEGGLLHRLDTSTSGAVAVADDPEDLAGLRELFAGRALAKRYLLLAARDVPWDEHVIDAPIGHHPKRRDRMVVRRGASTPHRGRWHEAETTFRRLAGRLWEVRMSTGVMHQIRVHAAFLGLPLVGDPIYGGGPTPADAPAGVTFFLHHAGFEGGGVRTAPVPDPGWATAARP